MHNSVTRRLLRELEPRTTFDGYACVAPDGTRHEAKFGSEADTTGEIVSDIGVIVRAPNPFDDRKHVTLLMGSRTFGCLIAARYLLHDYVREAAARTSASERFELIVKGKVVDGEPQGIELVGVW